ncbi:hypothetical protein ACFC3F_11750 [Microbacterium sp. NPDC055910]|uniref:COG1470 family protein n=1 Tax=Microbacterium sp. NPDC055910 TaxID=3345659 RepID=UPI0035D83C04
MRGRQGTKNPAARLAAVVAVGLLAGSAAAVSAAPASSDAALAWGIAPASAVGADGRVSIRATLDPGAVATEHVELSNLSDAPLTFALAGADGTITPEGDFDVLADGATSTRAGLWIDVPAEVTVPPRSNTVVPVSITVPADALPGDHPAGIVATPARDLATAEGVTFVARTGVRLHLRVAGELAPALTPRVTALDYEPSWNPLAPGQLRITWEVANTGNVRLGGEPTLSVSGLGGLVSQVEGERLEQFRELLPDGLRAGVTTVDAWPLFALAADTVVTPSVVGDDLVETVLPTGIASATVIAVPWVHLAILVAAGLVVAVIIGRVRARRPAPPSTDAAPRPGT